MVLRIDLGKNSSINNIDPTKKPHQSFLRNFNTHVKMDVNL